ncbi:hypothetical protein OPAG_06916 [Rhodococcus opacus PD630]|uniref:hypothetical protein n=1 Tax=Rhodococcus opacus TaxID=37919 RepID=UPI00029CC5F6|nr:hypothetical protein [Rhodococcus opacus]AHK36131.1 hypothetical protein Pd630_LPD16172 [Rhodococcus opacus PD630]EHI43628.1 hypothetical protein OPAG_06916 [Rhodococcus opacus PD630]UDH01247.1 hypothetical protein K2Z90_007711 [Rhodococcus opacus PD630]
MTQTESPAYNDSPTNPGDPGTLILENERVRIWELVMKPGEICNWHIHEFDHLLVLVNGGDVTATLADGATIEAPFPDNVVLFVPKGTQPEIAKNTSPDRTLRELIIEFKDPSPATELAMEMVQFFQDGTPTTCRPE